MSVLLRKFLFPVCVLFLLLIGCDDQHDKAKKQSVAALEAFFNEMEHGELIINSDNLEAIMEALDEQLGAYLSGNFTRKIENDIYQSLKMDRNFADDPQTITFFLTNSGDGYQFAKGDVSKHSSWLTLDDEIVGSEIRIKLNLDIPEWPHSWEESATVTMMKIDKEWKIDDVRYSSGVLESSMTKPTNITLEKVDKME